LLHLYRGATRVCERGKIYTLPRTHEVGEEDARELFTVKIESFPPTARTVWGNECDEFLLRSLR